MTTFHARLLLGAAALALTGTALAQTAPAKGPRYGSFGVDLTAQDASVKPGDDFWTFANGAWDKRTAIAPDRTSAGVSVVLVDEAELQVRQILDDAVRNAGAVGAGAEQLGELMAA